MPNMHTIALRAEKSNTANVPSVSVCATMALPVDGVANERTLPMMVDYKNFRLPAVRVCIGRRSGKSQLCMRRVKELRKKNPKTRIVVVRKDENQ